MMIRIPYKSTAFIILLCNIFFATYTFAQDESEKVEELNGKVDGLSERTATLEASVLKLSQMKITGYVQPQWVWNDIDSLTTGAAEYATRNTFQIRRGRVKFTHATVIDPTTGFSDVSAVVYPDIIESGVTLKEVYAKWNISTDMVTSLPELSLQAGAMNRPFGYEIEYSSSKREIAERSTAENRLFNGERDLGAQLTWSPSLGDIRPELAVGLFNGTDNFAQGPVAAFGAANKLGFSSAPIGTKTYAVPAGADSAFKAQVNAAVAKESILTLAANGAAIKQNQKELISHLRVPFLINDEFSFDLGASLSMGGIFEPSDIVGEYSGSNGALVLTKSDNPHASHNFNAAKGETNNTFLGTNRSVIGADAQVYLSVLPIGGTIVKAELYTGHVPFYGSAGLFSQADSALLGTPVASTITKNVLGYYAMLVQNISGSIQLAIRYDVYDPNTDVQGMDFAVNSGSPLRGVGASTGFGGDLSLSTLSVAVNAYVSGAIRFMLNYDHPMSEEFTRATVAGGSELVTIPDPKDDKITIRMQYAF